MGNRFMKWAAVLSSVALLSGALVVTANAHIGSSHSQVSTDGPDLVSAEATSRTSAEFCFDEAVDSVESETEFHLAGYDSEYEEDSDNAEDTGECVEVDFPIDADADVRELTVAHVDDGAVEDADGDGNPVAAVALGGSTAEGGMGITTAPNLVSYEATNDSIIYTFDQNLDCSQLTDVAADAENFGYYDEAEDDSTTPAGKIRDTDFINHGDSMESCDDDEIEIGFDDGDEDVDDEADRVFVANDTDSNVDAQGESIDVAVDPSGEVCQPDSTGGTNGACTAFETLGSEIEDRPDLTDADRSDNDQWLYSFDEDVEDDPITDAYFHIYQEDGNEATPDDAACSEDNDNQVECTYENDDWVSNDAGDLPAYETPEDMEEAQDFEIPLAAVEHCAVEEVDDGRCSTYGSVGIAESEIAPGATDAPDLETVELIAVDEQVRYCFDENISDTDGDVDDNNFFVLEADGDRTSAGSTAVDDVEDNCALVDFDEEDIASAVAGGVDAAAVVDWLENENVQATGGTAVTDSGTTGTGTGGTDTTTTTQTGTDTTQTTTTTTTTTTGTGTRPQPDKVKVATNLTIRLDRAAKAFKGSVGSSKKKCQVGRSVVLKKVRKGRSNKTVGRSTSNRKGNWKIKKRRVKRGQKYYAVVFKKKFTNRRGQTIVCLPDRSPRIKISRGYR